MIRLALFLLLSISLFANDTLKTQSTKSLLIRAEGGLLSTITDFNSYKGITNCCSQFTGSAGFNFEVSAGMNFPLSKKFLGSNLSYSLLLGYRSTPIYFSEEETIGYKIEDNSYNPIVSNFVIDNSISFISLKNRLAFNDFIANGFDLEAGIDLLYGISNSYNQFEEALSPSNFYFDAATRSRVRGQASGAIPDFSSINANITLGAKYNAYQAKEYGLSPYFNTNYYVMPIVSGLNWQTFSFNVGIEVAYNLRKEDTPPPPPPMPKEIPQVETPKPLKVDTLIAALSVSANGNEVKQNDELLLTTSRTITELKIDILPIIFYKQSKNEAIEGYKLGNRNLLVDEKVIMQSVINELKDYNGELLVKSITHNFEDTTIAKYRLESVVSSIKSKYPNIKVVEENRIIELKEGEDERVLQDNQRIEIKVKGKDLTSLYLQDEIKEIKEELRLNYENKSYSNNTITSERVALNLNGNLMEQRQDKSSAFIIKPTNDKADNYTLRLEVLDDKGNERVMEQRFLVRNAIKEEKIVKPYINSNKDYEDYYIGFFDFDKSELHTVNYEVIQRIKSLIAEGKKVEIIPQTDGIGNLSYNRNLKKQRYNSAIKEFPFLKDLKANYSAVEEQEDTPYKRLFSRSILIRVYR
jgi:hypothetical protein